MVTVVIQWSIVVMLVRSGILQVMSLFSMVTVSMSFSIDMIEVAMVRPSRTVWIVMIVPMSISTAIVGLLSPCCISFILHLFLQVVLHESILGRCQSG